MTHRAHNTRLFSRKVTCWSQRWSLYLSETGKLAKETWRFRRVFICLLALQA
ncbi:hypothetical protein Plhal304r1_c027g0089981 [Plasmopara halstedii]